VTKLRALIWDVDGTLAETERDGHRVAFNKAFEEAGLPWRWDEEVYGQLLRVTGGKERIRHHWRQVDPEAANQPDAADRVMALHSLKTEHYLKGLRDGAVTLRPGVARVLAEARRAGVLLAIASTTSEVNVRELLQHTLGPHAWTWFDCVAAGDLVTRKKPSPDIYAWVLGRLAVRARECLAIEDSVNGVDSARAIGIPVVVTRSVYSADEDVGRVCADLTTLGDPESPAQGVAFGRRVRGVIGLPDLERWHRRWVDAMATA